MSIESATLVLWNYSLLKHNLKKASAIVVLVSTEDVLVEHAAKLFEEKWAPIIVFSGKGIEENLKFNAESFSKKAIELGIPSECVIVENNSTNLGQHYEFTKNILIERDIQLNELIVVTKKFIERRSYATGKIWFPNTHLILTSPDLSFEHYYNSEKSEEWIQSMVADIDKIQEYPKLGYQIEQFIPNDVASAYNFLVLEGY